MAIARDLLINPSLILADEPTGNLDSSNAQQIIDLLRHLTKNLGKTVVVATHDRGLARLADRVVMLRDGSIQDDSGEPDRPAVNLVVPLKVGCL